MAKTGLKVFSSNSMEVLADICAVLMSEYPLSDPFDHEKVVVMNLGITNFLSQRLAMQNKITALVDYDQVWQLIYQVHRTLNPMATHESFYDREHITWNLYSQIKELKDNNEAGNNELYLKLNHYLADDTYGDKAYELSAKIADVFDQYQMYRPRWIEKWNEIPQDAFIAYERDSEDPSNPINKFIESECEYFTRRKSGFLKKQSKAPSAEELEAGAKVDFNSDETKAMALENLHEAVDVTRSKIDMIRKLFKSNVWQIKLWCSLRYNLDLMSVQENMEAEILDKGLEWTIAHLDRAQVIAGLVTQLRDAHFKQGEYAPDAPRKKVMPPLFERVFIFGVSAFPRVVVEFFDALSLHCNINLMLLNPCREYWGDISSRFRADFAKYTQAIQSSFKNINTAIKGNALKTSIMQVPFMSFRMEDYDDTGERIDGNQLLFAYGQQGRDNLYMLLDRDPTPDFISCFPDEDDDVFEISEVERAGSTIREVRGGTLLQRLQNHLLSVEQKKEQYVIAPDDRSISIHSCHTMRREVEVLHDAILECFNRAKLEGRKLLPRDIVVMVPTINDYAPHITAVFGGNFKEGDKNFIPFVISDRTEADANTVAQSLLKLLEISTSRITSSMVIDLLTEEAIANRFGITRAEVDVIARWITDNNIFWGLDDNDVSEYAQIPIPGTFSEGMDRMLLGSMLGESASMPCFSEIEGMDSVILGKFWDFLCALKELRQRFTPQLALAPDDWNLELDRMLTRRFFDDSEKTIKSLRGVKTVIANLKKVISHIDKKPMINLPVFAAALRQGLTAQRNYRPFLRGKVNFCSLVPMRAVPFEHVFILGLNDGDFPREERAPGFNLMATHELFERGDRSRGIDDRFLFLEAILSARQSLYLSYIGQNPINKTKLNASVVLSELIYYLKDMCTIDGIKSDDSIVRQDAVERRLLTEERLNPYHVDNYVQRAGNIPSFDQTYIHVPHRDRKRANVLALGYYKEFESNYESSVLDFDSLMKFMKNPSDVFLNDVLQIRLDDYGRYFLQEDENFTLSPFEENQIVNELISLAYKDRLNNLNRRAALGQLPYGIFKTQFFNNVLEKIDSIVSVIEDRYGIDSLQEINLMSCDKKQVRVIIAKEYLYRKWHIDFDQIVDSQAFLNFCYENGAPPVVFDGGPGALSDEEVKELWDSFVVFEFTLQANARSVPLIVQPFKEFKSKNIGNVIYPEGGSYGELGKSKEFIIDSYKDILTMAQESICQYLYTGDISKVKEVRLIDQAGNSFMFMPFTSEEQITYVLQAFLIAYVLGHCSPFPCMPALVRKLRFEEVANIEEEYRSKIELKIVGNEELDFSYDRSSAFLYRSSNVIFEDEILHSLASGFFKFYLQHLASHIREA